MVAAADRVSRSRLQAPDEVQCPCAHRIGYDTRETIPYQVDACLECISQMDSLKNAFCVIFSLSCSDSSANRNMLGI